jgi:GTP cyclohydrolase I
MTTDIDPDTPAGSPKGRHAPLNEPGVREAVRGLLTALGEDLEREGLRDTPRRISQMYAEIFSGLDVDPAEYLSVQFGNGHDEMVILRDIPFYSMCEHHFLPFHGVAHVGYIPDGRVVGISKIARVVEAFAKRPQLQERLTAQVADCIMQTVNPDGVAVVVEAEHLCMTMRGVRKPGSRMVTSAMRGGFRKQSVTRAEFLSLVQHA